MTRRRQAINPRPKGQRASQTIDWIAPIDGWRTDVAWAQLPPNAAATLNNFFPEAGYIRARNGSTNYATGLTGSVGTIIPYMGATNKLFACTSNYIYEITAGGSSFSPLVSGLTSNHWSWAQATNVGGNWLLACNGQDPAQIYSGTSWAAASFTGPSSTNVLSVVCWYRGYGRHPDARVNFIEWRSDRLHGVRPDQRFKLELDGNIQDWRPRGR